MQLPSIFKVLNCTKSGLTDSEALARLSKFGFNKLPQKPHAPIWKIFFRQFVSPLIYILVFAAAISMLTKEPTDDLPPYNRSMC